ncbi:nucleolar complex protein 14 [Phytophthora cinnamomi]|uniref:nucleolar complex protein 14 n=1 Tax=Phytophthora cinnamomi TaxID=4785 RepID=UPI0035599F22|nr:nucleolar complex protein 14 [Phytophthora cinnamomi]
MASWKPVSSKTLKLDMQTCSANVGDVIEKELGDIFGVMWDGWTHGTVHYVGIYGVTFVNGKRRERLLSLSPLVDGSQDAEVHIAMFKRVLSLYNKNVSMVAFLVGDNCATNRRIATLMELPLVGARVTATTSQSTDTWLPTSPSLLPSTVSWCSFGTSTTQRSWRSTLTSNLSNGM